MGYKDLLAIANIVDENLRLRTFGKYYKSLKIRGLHYVNHIASSNTLSISCPNHSTHHEVTSYLLIRKSESSINTARGEAQHLKKFLDFLLLWDIDLLDGDLLVILTSFTDYLRIIQAKSNSFYKLPSKTIGWSFLTKVPLNQQAYHNLNVIPIGVDAKGLMRRKEYSQLKYSTIEGIVGTAVRYLIFLHEQTQQYEELPVNQIPKRIKDTWSMLSGTLGPTETIVNSVGAILSKSGLKAKKKKGTRALDIKNRVFTPEQMDIFMNSLPHNHHQNRLLFHILRWFGLRAAEAANLMIDPSTIPDDLLFKEHHTAREYIKNKLRGDVEFVPQLKKWVCTVIERDNEDYRSQHKSDSDRSIPLVFSQDLFLDLLLNALRERQFDMNSLKQSHCFLFYSRNNKSRGCPLTGAAIFTRYQAYANKLLQTGVDLTQYSPHSFRHYFATYLLRVRLQDVSDVSRWLGHSSTEITRETYLHYLPHKDQNKEVVQDMALQFKIEGEEDLC